MTKNCQRCGSFASEGNLLCDSCREVDRLELEVIKGKDKLREFVGPDGRSWRLTIREQSQTVGTYARARDKAKALLELGFWFMDLEEVK